MTKRKQGKGMQQGSGIAKNDTLFKLTLYHGPLISCRLRISMHWGLALSQSQRHFQEYPESAVYVKIAIGSRNSAIRNAYHTSAGDKRDSHPRWCSFHISIYLLTLNNYYYTHYFIHLILHYLTITIKQLLLLLNIIITRGLHLRLHWRPILVWGTAVLG